MTPETPQPLPMASTGCACCTPASDQTAPAAEAAPSAGTSATYQVEGMTCGHCATSVTEEITALEGVTDVRIDLVAGGLSTVTVSGMATPEAVQAAVEAAGYAVVAA
ncbi:cation transporter [Kocuria indica]|uniref:heavy-metal-associated domain-containing protein n=1 Tax=Kocuria TaxID=57493 RepID=UPI0011A30900|nr:MULTISPECIES: cation transporter [Kocuria]MCG7433288.1 cation transporter [Kocuria indica]MCT2021930.1 cation transporter [Kocuria marina]